eukprot:GFYU01005996.1.p1 GENE.GFYU01005996.1~~GFYU01005996.1.p1  ORF type:complete len:233 (+),score=69.09 GFYU01005996.1:154-852(+)
MAYTASLSGRTSKLLQKLSENSISAWRANKPGAEDALLIHAVAQGNLKEAQWLLERGANPDVTNLNGSTPLHVACGKGILSMVTLLIQFRASLDIKEKDMVGGYTPLHYAVKARRLQIANVLLDSGANPNIPDSLGFLPLHLAARDGSLDMTVTLIAKGADVTREDKGGKTAYYWAKQMQHANIMGLLPEVKYNPLQHMERVQQATLAAMPSTEKKKKKGGKGKKGGKKKKK